MIGGELGINLERSTLVFPYCWVCGKRFKTSVPPGPAVRHDHHIVPRNAGGLDGPLVSLCDTHHSTLHRIAERMHLKQQFTELLAGETTEYAKKIIWLAGVAYRAELTVVNDPNKHFGVSFSLSTDEVQILDALRKHYGGVSRKELVLMGLKLLARNLNEHQSPTSPGRSSHHR